MFWKIALVICFGGMPLLLWAIALGTDLGLLKSLDINFKHYAEHTTPTLMCILFVVLLTSSFVTIGGNHPFYAALTSSGILAGWFLYYLFAVRMFQLRAAQTQQPELLTVNPATRQFLQWLVIGATVIGIIINVITTVF